MNFWQIIGLMLVASALIPVVVYFCVKFYRVAKQRGEELAQRMKEKRHEN